MVDKRKPQHKGHCAPEDLEMIRGTCLYIATILGDLIGETVIVGGLVPSLIVPQPPVSGDKHPGTMDLDIGLSLAVLDGGHYEKISKRLRAVNFAPDQEDSGRIVRQRWVLRPEGVYIDFLIPPKSGNDQGGRLQSLEKDFAAVFTPGLHLAFEDREQVQLKGKTIRNESASRSIWVCGPAAFVVLKALAFRGRGERKDAFDLFYVLRNFGAGIDDVMTRLAPFIKRRDPDAIKALKILEEDFAETDNVGPVRVAEFELGVGARDDNLQTDVVSTVQRLLALLRTV